MLAPNAMRGASPSVSRGAPRVGGAPPSRRGRALTTDGSGSRSATKCRKILNLIVHLCERAHEKFLAVCPAAKLLAQPFELSPKVCHLYVDTRTAGPSASRPPGPSISRINRINCINQMNSISINGST